MPGIALLAIASAVRCAFTHCIPDERERLTEHAIARERHAGIGCHERHRSCCGSRTD